MTRFRAVEQGKSRQAFRLWENAFVFEETKGLYIAWGLSGVNDKFIQIFMTTSYAPFSAGLLNDVKQFNYS